MERINDHKRVETFLSQEALSVTFSILSFIIFGIVLLFYNLSIFIVFLFGSILYGIWISTFLNKRKVLDYLLLKNRLRITIKHFNF